MNKLAKILIGCGTVGLLAGGIALSVGINKNSEPVINQSVLYIGIPKTQDDLPVKLHITVRSSSGTATKTYSSEELQPLEGQDENLVFLNYSYDPVIPFGNTDIGYWLSDESNSIKVRTECLELIYSDYINIDKTGVWFVNVASQDGYAPDFSHSYIYSSGGISV